jgi:hypothetical protein
MSIRWNPNLGLKTLVSNVEYTETYLDEDGNEVTDITTLYDQEKEKKSEEFLR